MMTATRDDRTKPPPRLRGEKGDAAAHDIRTRLVRTRRRAGRLGRDADTAEAEESAIDREIAELAARAETLRAARDQRRDLRSRLRREVSDLEREAVRLGRAPIKAGLRVRLAAIERLRDIVALVQSGPQRRLGLEAAATSALHQEARRLEKRYNGGRRAPPRGDDLRSGPRPKRRADAAGSA